jgi:phosphoribosylglycinamide formyltransferase-1
MNRVAIFASGSGTNAENIIGHFCNSKIARVALVLTENPNAFVLKRAQKLGVPAHIFTMEALKNGGVAKLLHSERIDFIVLAGFLKLIPADIITMFANKIINIHPALLPKYGGKGMYGNNVHKAVIDAGETETGITIHLVNEHYDKGDILFQAKCPVHASDTVEDVASRIHLLEYKYFPSIIDQYIQKLSFS